MTDEDGLQEGEGDAETLVGNEDNDFGRDIEHDSATMMRATRTMNA